jgi:hypothetical protein
MYRLQLEALLPQGSRQKFGQFVIIVNDQDGGHCRYCASIFKSGI